MKILVRTIAFLVAGAAGSLHGQTAAMSNSNPGTQLTDAPTDTGAELIRPREMYLACQNAARRQKFFSADSALAKLIGKAPPLPTLDPGLRKFCESAKLPHNQAADVDPIWRRWDVAAIPTVDTVRAYAAAEQEQLDNGAPVFDANDAAVQIGQLVFDSSGVLSEGTKGWLGAVAHVLKQTPGSSLQLANAVVAPDSLDPAARARRFSSLNAFLADSGVTFNGGVLIFPLPPGTFRTRSSEGLTRIRERLRFSSRTEAPPPVTENSRAPLLARPTDLTSAILYGVTDFVVDQAKEEMALYTTRTVMRGLCTAAEPAKVDARGQTKSRVKLSALPYLPGTCRVFGFAADRASEGYLPSPTALRASIISDLERLPTAMLTRVPQLGPAAQKVEAAQTTISILQDVIKGRDPVGVLAETLTDPVALASVRGGAPVSIALARFARLLDFESAGRKEIAEVTGTPPSADTVLLYALKALAVDVHSDAMRTKLPEFAVAAGNALKPSLLDGLAVDVERLTSLHRQVESTAEQLDTLRVRLAEMKDTTRSARLAGYASLIRTTGDLLAAPLQKQLTESEWRSTRKFLAPTLDVAENMSRSDYVGAVRSLISVADSIDSALGNGLMSDLRLVNFVADVATAQTSTDVTKAFSRYADPMSGLNRKRNADLGWFWALNTYLGLSAGYEWVMNPGSIDRPNGWVFGPVLPVGIELGRTSLAGKHWLHPRVVAQLLNLGALASLRVSGNDSVDVAPAKINQVFSPGVWLGAGLGDSPVALLIGGEYAPQARTITGGSRPRYNAKRVSVALVVDVPLFVR